MREAGLRDIARAIFEQTLDDCSIERAFAERVKTASGADGAATLLFGSHAVDFAAIQHVRVVAAGKAAGAMLKALLTHLPRRPGYDLAGVLITPGEPPELPGIQHYPGRHPFPDEASFAGARAALEMVSQLPADATRENTLCIFLISGGASSMMELPLDPAITPEETMAFHRALVHSGAPITEINCVRKHFSAVKGGRLALAAQRATCLTILLSDVPAGELDSIGSGPTMPDLSTVDECRRILRHYGLVDQFPLSVRSFFLSPAMPETPKPGEMAGLTWTILSADDMAEAAREQARSLGYLAVIDNICDNWDYRHAASYLLGRMRELRRKYPRVCLISAGEVVVRPDTSEQEAIVAGNGGRNQHFTLYAATLLEREDGPMAILSAGSDGIDGNSDAAGAVVDTTTLLDGAGGSRLAAARQALREFHSTTFLKAAGAAIVTGPTNNNLRDLRLLIADPNGEGEDTGSAHGAP